MDALHPKDGPLLEVRDLEMAIFADGGNRIVRAVNGLSFTLARGRTLGIIGESGSGKSMTSLSILRLLPRGARILGGQVLFDGQDLVALSERDLRRMRGRHIAMILQDPMVSLDPLYRVGDQVAEPLRTHQGMSGDALRARVIDLLGAVGIPAPESRFDQYPHQMSGGMLQRIVGATAISCGPELLIADEPTTALDPTVQAQYLDLLEELQQRTGLALIIITHDLGVAARLCDDVIVMYAGRAAEKAPVRTLFERPAHPYTQALLSTLPGRRPPGSHKRLQTIEGQPPDLAALPPGCPFAPRCPRADAKCRAEMPPEISLEADHTTACWYPTT
jgi:oligopeptide/dipeptide ABC transporter ATP-binding protein